MKIKWQHIVYLVVGNAVWAAMTSPRGGEEISTSTALLSVGPLKSAVPGFSLLLLFMIGLFLLTKRHIKGQFGVTMLYSIALMTLTAQLGLLFGASISIDPRIYILPACFFIFLISPPPSISEVTGIIRKVCLFYAYGSLAALMVIPDWAAEWGYEAGLIEGFNLRLHGLSGHANNLASLMVFYFVITLYSSHRKKLKYILSPVFLTNNITAAAVLFLCQSKTNWAVLFIVAAIYFTLSSVNGQKTAKRKVLLITIFAFVCAALGFLAIQQRDLILDSITSRLTVSQLDRASSLTGRFEIWAVIIDTWLSYPVFGYGSNIFKTEELFADSLGFAPSHAHNQLFQSLAEGGILGVIAMLWYSLLLFKGIKATKGDIRTLIQTMLIFFAIRSVTQSVYRSGFDEAFLMHLLMFGIIVSAQTAFSFSRQSQFRRNTLPT